MYFYGSSVLGEHDVLHDGTFFAKKSLKKIELIFSKRFPGESNIKDCSSLTK